MEEASALFARVHHMLTHGGGDPADSAGLGALAALSGVWEFPSRVKCAGLAWHTLRAPLKQAQTKGEA